MIKQILLILLGLFFLLNGVNHFYNTHILKEYADNRSLIAPKLMVILSGFLLIAGGATLITGYFIFEGIIALCVFLAVASFMLHKFWTVKERETIMLEAMHFVKNWAILFELVYIATTLE
ncbi:DoxX family membrane protein [uncultured Planktosalinus sp.]|uniref:DoxX family membrane protein n=1 Tax=uncultured Planktosalinus sp. TaxID=1810935 RepID=UPI0030DA3535